MGSSLETVSAKINGEHIEQNHVYKNLTTPYVIMHLSCILPQHMMICFLDLKLYH